MLPKLLPRMLHVFVSQLSFETQPFVHSYQGQCLTKTLTHMMRCMNVRLSLSTAFVWLQRMFAMEEVGVSVFTTLLSDNRHSI